MTHMFAWPVISSPSACPVSSNAPQTEYGTAPSAEVATSQTPDDLIAWWNSAIKDYDAMFLIYYRGVW